jgi:hypothetical protein
MNQLVPINSATPEVKASTMTEDEIAFRAAINVLRDTIESGRMPSGEPLRPDAAELHQRAAEHLEILLRQEAPKPA